MRLEWEFERKFVVTYLPEGLLETRKPVKVRQGYLASEDERQIKIRDEGGCYSMTVKQGFGLKRQETHIALTEQQFNELWPLTHHMRVEKQRYSMGFFGHTLVIDVFSGHLAPLIMAEVEFDNEISSRQFLPPDFAEFEVTHLREYHHDSLARMGLPESMAMANTY